MFNMNISSTIIDRINDMEYFERKELIQNKSEYDIYLFEYNGQVQKDYYRYMLDRFNLYKYDHTNSTNNGIFFYSPRPLIKSNGVELSGFAIYSSDKRFVENGCFESQYNKNKNNKIDFYVRKNSEFDSWLKDFIIKIFGGDAKSMYSPRKFVYEKMKNVKRFDDFLNEKKIPEISIDIKDLLSTLKDNKIDIFRKFKINKDAVAVNGNIEDLYSNRDFNINLKKNKLKKGKLQNTQYSETLLDDKYTLKFFFLYNEKSIELEEPEFIILQYYDMDNTKSSDILGFTNSDYINSFYEKLTDATIELTKGDDTYVYQTTNGGNNWQMKNVQMEDDEMKGDLDKKELQKIINKKNLKVSNE